MLVERQEFVCDLRDAPVRERIVGRHRHGHLGDLDVVFVGVEVLSERVAEIPAHGVVGPDGSQQKQDQEQDPDRYSANV